MAKKLTRSNNKLIAGVVAGFAEYFNQDILLFRLLFILFLFLTGLFPGVLFYLVAWVLMPESNSRIIY